MNIGTGAMVSATLDTQTKDSLEEKFAAIQAGWLTEHTLEGRHAPMVSKTILPAEFFSSGAPTDFAVVANHPSQTYLYVVQGLRMAIQLVLRDCTVANTPTEFRILIPDGWFASHDGVTVCWVDNNGTHTAAKAAVTAGGRYIAVTKIAAGAWSNATAATDIGLTWEFNVRR